jgi:hypothetical protein
MLDFVKLIVLSLHSRSDRYDVKKSRQALIVGLVIEKDQKQG